MGSPASRTSFACIEPDEVDMMFLRGNVRLVADVWNPILDIEVDFLLVNPQWSDRFIKKTCVVLGWLIYDLPYARSEPTTNVIQFGAARASILTPRKIFRPWNVRGNVGENMNGNREYEQEYGWR